MFGGGTSGGFAFPNAAGEENPTAIYRHWLVDSGEIASLITAAQSADTPYTNETVPDPDTYMNALKATRTQHRMNIFEREVDELDVEENFASFVDNAVDKIDDGVSFPTIDISDDVTSVHSAERSAISSAMTAAVAVAATAVADTPIADMVTAYENRIKKQYLRAISRMASNMADIGAVNSTAFAFGMAAINRDMLNDVDFYDSSLDVKTYEMYTTKYMDAFIDAFKEHLSSYIMLEKNRKSDRNRTIIDGAKTMAAMLSNRMNLHYTAAHLQAEINRMRYTAKSKEQMDQIHLSQQEATWDLELYTYGANMLAASGGAAVLPPRMSTFEMIVSSAASVLGQGANLASVIAG